MKSRNTKIHNNKLHNTLLLQTAPQDSCIAPYYTNLYWITRRHYNIPHFTWLLHCTALRCDHSSVIIRYYCVPLIALSSSSFLAWGGDVIFFLQSGTEGGWSSNNQSSSTGSEGFGAGNKNDKQKCKQITYCNHCPTLPCPTLPHNHSQVVTWHCCLPFISSLSSSLLSWSRDAIFFLEAGEGGWSCPSSSTGFTRREGIKQSHVMQIHFTHYITTALHCIVPCCKAPYHTSPYHTSPLHNIPLTPHNNMPDCTGCTLPPRHTTPPHNTPLHHNPNLTCTTTTHHNTPCTTLCLTTPYVTSPHNTTHHITLHHTPYYTAQLHDRIQVVMWCYTTPHYTIYHTTLSYSATIFKKSCDAITFHSFAIFIIFILRRRCHLSSRTK